MVVQRDRERRQQRRERPSGEDVKPAPVGRAVTLQEAGQKSQVKEERQPVDQEQDDADDRPRVAVERPPQVVQHPVQPGHERRQQGRFAGIILQLARVQDLIQGLPALLGDQAAIAPRAEVVTRGRQGGCLRPAPGAEQTDGARHNGGAVAVTNDVRTIFHQVTHRRPAGAVVAAKGRQGQGPVARPDPAAVGGLTFIAVQRRLQDQLRAENAAGDGAGGEGDQQGVDSGAERGGCGVHGPSSVRESGKALAGRAAIRGARRRGPRRLLGDAVAVLVAALVGGD